jgi:hypothetical protein
MNSDIKLQQVLSVGEVGQAKKVNTSLLFFLKHIDLLGLHFPTFGLVMNTEKYFFSIRKLCQKPDNK